MCIRHEQSTPKCPDLLSPGPELGERTGVFPFGPSRDVDRQGYRPSCASEKSGLPGWSHTAHTMCSLVGQAHARLPAWQLKAGWI